MYPSSRFNDKKKMLFQEIRNIFLCFSCTCTHARMFVYGCYAPEISLSKDWLDQRLVPTEFHKTRIIRESLSLAYEQQEPTKLANITCKRCSDRKFEESIMDSQFAAIYFQNIGIVFPGFWTIWPSLENFYHRSELLPNGIFNQSRKLHQFAISFIFH